MPDTKRTITRQAIDAKLSEVEFQRTVMEMAKALGWRVYHNRKTARRRRDGSIVHHTSYSGDGGFPDLVLARAGKIIIAELKSERGKPSGDQVLWFTALGGLGDANAFSDLVGVYLWKPSDMDKIEERLR